MLCCSCEVNCSSVTLVKRQTSPTLGMSRRPRHRNIGSISEVADDDDILETTAIHKSAEARAHRDAHKRSTRTPQRIIDKHITNATSTKSRFCHSPVAVLRQLSDTPDWVVDHQDFFHISDDMDEIQEQREQLQRYYRARSMDPPALPLRWPRDFLVKLLKFI